MLRTLRNAGIAISMVSMIALNAYADEMKINGSTTVHTFIFKENKAKIEAQSGLTITLTTNGSGRGLEDLVSGKCDAAMISAPLDNFKDKIKGTDGMQASSIGNVKVAFVVNKANKVHDLKMDQIKGILSGAIKNWKEVGGDNKAIIVIAEPSGGGIRTTVEEKLLEKKPIGATVKEVPSVLQVAKTVGQVADSLGVLSASEVSGDSVAVKTDKSIEQPLSIVTKGAPDAKATKVIDAIKSLGLK